MGAPCACGGTCPKCTSGPSLLAQADFSGVSVHPSAPEITGPANARAVTIGQDIFFHPGEYQPGTPEGDRLIAHELAHTLQTRRAHESGSDEDASEAESDNESAEENAEALAEGKTHHVEHVSAQATLRSPFDAETDDQRTRRQTLIQSISNAEHTLINLLQTGGLIQGDEVVVDRNGVRGVVIPANTVGTPDEFFSSYTAREARIRRIIRFLQTLGTRYRSSPIPAAFAPPTQDSASPPQYSSVVNYTDSTGHGVNQTFVGSRSEWADLQAAYQRYLVSQGLTSPDYEADWYYLDPAARVSPGAARGAPRLATGIQTGVYMIVPDIEHEPLRYWRLTGTAPYPRGAVTIELWHDSLGYYYLNQGQRIDVPSPWEH